MKVIKLAERQKTVRNKIDIKTIICTVSYCIFSSADLVIAVMGDTPPQEASFKVIIIIISFTITSMYTYNGQH